MNLSVKHILFFATVSFLVTNCRKKESPPLSATAYINSFTLLATDNPSLKLDVIGKISADTISLELKTGTNVSNFVPTIDYVGASIIPANKEAQNFTNPVLYTVTSANGTKYSYKVIVHYLSPAKEITSFLLKKSDNPALTEDLSGIISGDSILINLPSGMSPSALTPEITYTGFSVLPANHQKQDFTIPLSYNVTAEDGTIKSYKVFAAATHSVYISGDDGYLYAINGINGTLQWKFYTGAPSVPTYYNGTVFVAGADNVIYAVNTTDGTLKWKSTPPKGSYALTIPATWGGNVFFAGAGYLNYPNSIYAYYAGFVYALDATTGQQQWLQTLYPNISYNDSRLTNVTVKDNIACVYDIMNGMTVFNAADGSLLWTKIGDMLGRTNPVIANNAVYYGNEGGMRAVDATTGQNVWQLFGPSNPIVFSSPTISDSVIYAVGGRSTLFSIDFNGAVRSQIALGGSSFYAPFASNNNLYILNTSGELNAYSVQSGALIWKRGGFTSQPVVADKDIFICDNNKRLNCLDAITGIVKWVSLVNNNFSQPLCLVDGKGNAYHVTDSGEQQ